jgi:hypothetical protein
MEITTIRAAGLVSVFLTFARGFDLVLLLFFWAARERDLLRECWTAYINTAILLQSVGLLVACFALLQGIRYVLGLTRGGHSEITPDEFPVGPLLFPCRTDHVRFVPTKHAFSYSYLFVGMPIRWKGRRGGMISCEQRSPPWYLAMLHTLSLGLGGTGAWWDVNGDDYLGRGHDPDGLPGKLRTFLRSQVCHAASDSRGLF